MRAERETMSHDKIAGRFDEWAEAGKGEGMEHEHGDVARQVIERLEIKPGYRILDLGCGTGWATRELAQAAPGVQAIGVDVSPKMVARAEEQSSLRIRARYEHGKFEGLDFPDAHFDLAFSVEAVYYAVDLDVALREIHRVLKPGASAHILIDHYAERPETENWSELMGLDLHRLSEDEWREAFLRAGFHHVETTRVHDSRGPGDAAGFQASRHFADWESYRLFHEAGALWIHAVA
jgi:ubiquinone/menaquinone biosynthesis C-methylase UbiE